uniref:Rho guanine nucleotide exchange factor (GEF) 2a n=1 Tax=Oncorhynchus kisutch TaxID=8019 RepID=A0A8C7HRU7_ONCKI
MPTTPSSYAHPPACLPSSSSIPPTPPYFPYPSPPCSPGPGVKGFVRAGGVTLRSPATRHLTHLDPWRRHSWEPGAIVTVQQKGMEPSDNRSVSLENLDPEEMEKVLGVALDVRRGGRDPRRNPITQEGSLSSLTEEEAGSDVQHYSILEEQSNQLQGCSASAPTLSVARHRNLQSTAPRPRSDCYETLPYRQLGGSTQSVDSDLGLLLWGREGSWTEVERDEAREERTGSPLERTFSFLRKMAGNRKNKEKERMREREKEARDREARYSNGHLFTSLTVSGTTLCSACNKSITAKEALSCPTCSVTIHNRCRDTLPNCAKMKQRQQKMALMRNNSALQNVTLRTKTPMMRERPSSAIYHSDNLRQSLLGSRRGRSGLSLSKSVSTNNITGNLNDDSPLGLRRILSQSTDSLNFRNRAMSMESLNDEGEEYYTSMLEEMEIEGRDFEADSWSMAVDSGYLQTHRKDIIKRQDVIYELIQTELHHVRTLRIMERVFRQGMLEEVQLEPGVVHAIFPCLDRLTAIHARFLAQLLTRRNHSLQPGSTYNFTIHQLGDVLLEQFSGQCADEMRKTYAEFCSRHLKAVKLYKELLARDKRFQYFIRRVCRGHLLRRHGVQECILLVTQRITKYPVLIQRILDNTKDNEEEASCLAQSLTRIRELLTSVDQQVMELERTQRLQEIRARLDPRAEAKVRDGGLFRGGELLRRRLIHEGMLLWKTPGSRLKDVQVLLMTDILVFLQEKDQRFIFPCLVSINTHKRALILSHSHSHNDKQKHVCVYRDLFCHNLIYRMGTSGNIAALLLSLLSPSPSLQDKSPVLSLQNLMIREIANQERGLFLISDSSPPEMYEVHAASKDDKNTWIRLIQHTVRRYRQTQTVYEWSDRQTTHIHTPLIYTPLIYTHHSYTHTPLIYTHTTHIHTHHSYTHTPLIYTHTTHIHTHHSYTHTHHSYTHTPLIYTHTTHIHTHHSYTHTPLIYTHTTHIHTHHSYTHTPLIYTHTTHIHTHTTHIHTHHSYTHTPLIYTHTTHIHTHHSYTHTPLIYTHTTHIHTHHSYTHTPLIYTHTTHIHTHHSYTHTPLIYTHTTHIHTHHSYTHTHHSYIYTPLIHKKKNLSLQLSFQGRVPTHRD